MPRPNFQRHALRRCVDRGQRDSDLMQGRIPDPFVAAERSPYRRMPARCQSPRTGQLLTERHGLAHQWWLRNEPPCAKARAAIIESLGARGAIICCHPRESGDPGPFAGMTTDGVALPSIDAVVSSQALTRGDRNCLRHGLRGRSGVGVGPQRPPPVLMVNAVMASIDMPSRLASYRHATLPPIACQCHAAAYVLAMFFLSLPRRTDPHLGARFRRRLQPRPTAILATAA